ncbi:MAG: OmpA family protein [bacterium]|jgi:outer membrane protein OmpA-like peptidoglycan-associated protein
MAAWKRFVLAPIALGVLIAIVALMWLLIDRVGSINRGLESIEQRTVAVERRLADYSQKLDAQIGMARDAREEASRAKAEAAEMASARDSAVERARAAQSAAAAAESEAARAREAAREAETELAELRKKREEELNRMQEALSRIAPTRRTPLGLVVDLAEDSFKFDFDKADLKPENRELLSRIAGVLLASNGYRLFVYGHTDDVGTDEYNQGLSERRANAVADYLVRAGVPEEIIDRKGYGKSSPRVKGTSAEARRKNRRVEIGIVDAVISYDATVPSGAVSTKPVQ